VTATPAQLLGQLRDAIRVEVRAEMVDELRKWMGTLPTDEDIQQAYVDGVVDAINTLER